MYKQFIKENYNKILDILNCISVGIYITDGSGNTLLLNDESCKTGGLCREEILGKNMKELEKVGFIENSVTLKTLLSGKEEDIIQNLGDGGSVYVNGIPLYNEPSDSIDLVICTERNITETLTLKKLLEETTKNNYKIKGEMELLKKQNTATKGNLVAEDESTIHIVENARRVAKVDVTVLLTGPSGTGKEVFANFIHQNSQRVNKPFIKVNCAAIPETLIESELFGYEGGAFTGSDKNGKMGLFEMANHGTLFLDEIGEIPMHLQAKLLRAIQEKEITRVGGSKVIPLDIRLITATNRDLKAAVEAGIFRNDLYYRLNIMPIELLPLIGRKKDIKALADFFVLKFNKEYRLSKDITEPSVEVLQNYEWPGNIRELENVIERLMISFDGENITKFQVERVLGTKISLSTDLIQEGMSLEKTIDEYEKLILTEMAKKHKSLSKMANALKVNKTTLWRKMKKYALL